MSGRFVLGCFLLCISLPIFSQQRVHKIRQVDSIGEVDTIVDLNDILTIAPGQYKKGIYRTFEEFRKNAPSVPFEGEIRVTDEFNINRDFESYRIFFDDKIPFDYGTSIWGFSDGKSVFVSRKQTFNYKNIYDRVLYIGRYIRIRSFVFKDNSLGASMSRSEANGSNGFAVRKYIDINDGSFFKFNKSRLEQLLEKDSDLRLKYNQEKDKNRVMDNYLDQYYEIHKEEIIPLK